VSVSGAITISRDTHQLHGATSALLHYHLVVGGKVVGATAQSGLRYCNDHHHTRAVPARQKLGIRYKVVLGGGCRVGMGIGIGAGRKSQSEVARW